MRTTITKTGTSEVTLTATDPWTGETIQWFFWIPTSGGYVREGAGHTADDAQVCVGLGSRGDTLTASDGDALLAVIRREWANYRKAALADARR
jgi:hypothetical protein